MDIFLMILFGLISGVLGGMGMGGGTLLIPLLTIFMDFDQHLVQGINLIVFLPMAVVALIFHFKNKLVDFKKSWIIMIGGIIFGIVGAVVSQLVDSKQLKIYFGIFLILLGIFQFVSLFILKENKKSKKKLVK